MSAHSDNNNRRKTINDFFNELESHGIYRKKFSIDNNDDNIPDEPQKNTIINVYNEESTFIINYVEHLTHNNNSQLFDGMTLK